jgi:uncharacterized protein (DUF1800 family)
MKKLHLALAPLALFASLVLIASPAAGQDSGPEWNRRAAEHLLNRAGFGATPAEIDAAVARGLDATVDGLFLAPEDQVPLIEPERESGRDGMRTTPGMAVKALGKDNAPKKLLDKAREARRDMQRNDRGQLGDYTSWWLDTMIAGDDPLRDRMTLFWHGYFTSSMRDVKSSYQMIQQNQLLRTGALGSFGDLLFAVAKDPAMLEYLDNDENRKDAPNENFAREVMELFTLGEGHYTEDDIKEAARAFTGWQNKKGDFVESDRRHDRGEKTVLGVTGDLNGEDVLEILLEDEACASYVAGRIIEYLEGVAPSSERRTHYAALLRTSDFDVEALLRELFHDPAFYRTEVVGNRVAGPVDYLVGMSRRLDLMPPRVWLTYSSRLLGQELFFPPSVKGWDEGMAWITTASLMQRGNLAGVLLGVVDVDEIIEEDEVESMETEMDAEDEPKGNKRSDLLKRLRKIAKGWSPPIDLEGELATAGATSPGQVVDLLADRLLATELPAETRAYLVSEYEVMRAADTDTRPRFGDPRRDETLLRSFAHLILSLPEAQLN